MKRFAILLLITSFLMCGLGGCVLMPPSNDDSGMNVDWSLVTKILIVQDRETQSSWEVTDTQEVAAVCDLFKNAKYGEEKAGGGAGSFLRLQFFTGDKSLGKIVLASPDTVQYADGDSTVVLPITEGAWSEAQWDAFLEQLT